MSNNLYELVWFICLMAYQLLMGYLVLKFETYNLHMIVWFQVFLFNTNNFQIYLFGPHRYYHCRSDWTWE